MHLLVNLRDLHAHVPPPVSVCIPAGPATDVCGYDEHMVTFARKIAIGVVLFILGAAAAIFTDEVMHSDGIVLFATFSFVAAGLAFTIPAGMDHAAFAKRTPTSLISIRRKRRRLLGAAPRSQSWPASR